MSSFGLLVFNRNDIRGIVRVLRGVGDVVDETVIIDSSDPKVYDDLVSRVKGLGLGNVRIYRAIPLGYPDPLRAYGLSKVRTEYVLYLDADEIPNQKLVRDLRKLNKADAYTILRYETLIGKYTWQIRLYRKNVVRYRGIIHEQPIISGHMVRLPVEYYIVHGIEGDEFINGASLYERYALIELFTRIPHNLLNLHRIILLNNINAASRDTLLNKKQSKQLLYINLVLYLLYYLIRDRRSFNYVLNNVIEFLELSDNSRNTLSKISDEIYSSGGVIHYLCLDDEYVVDGLTRTFTWNISGRAVFLLLILYRHLFSKCALNFLDILRSLDIIINYFTKVFK